MGAKFVSGLQEMVDYTPDGADVDSGDVVVQEELVGIALRDIADGDLGALCVSGIFDLPREATTAFAAGQAVYWDADGDPEAGTAETGAAVDSTAEGSNKQAGVAVEAVTDADKNLYVRVYLGQK
jgi:predicted RecA/RadA family phage recombinase